MNQHAIKSYRSLILLGIVAGGMTLFACAAADELQKPSVDRTDPAAETASPDEGGAVAPGEYVVTHNDGSTFVVNQVGRRDWSMTQSVDGRPVDWTANIEGIMYFGDFDERQILMSDRPEMADAVPLQVLDPLYLRFTANAPKARDVDVQIRVSGAVVRNGNVTVPQVLERNGPMGLDRYDVVGYAPQKMKRPADELAELLERGFTLSDLKDAPVVEELAPAR